MLLNFFLVLAVLAVGILDTFLPRLIVWSIPLIIAIFLLETALAIVFLFFVSLFCYGKEPPEQDHGFCRSLAYHTMDCILSLFGFSLKGEGLDQIPREPCVIVCNHLSRFDPMVTFVLLRGRLLSFVSKKENMRIPIAGPILQKIGYIALDRENPLRAMRAIHTAAKRIKNVGYTIGIYPEGTRSKSGELLEFKPGAFVLAKKGECPLVISAIVGTNRPKIGFPLHRAKATWTVLKVISAEEVVSKKPEELSALCYDTIRGFLSQ